MAITIRVENQTDRNLVGVELGHGGNPSAVVAPQTLGDLTPGQVSGPVQTPANQADYRRLAALVDGRFYAFLSFDFTEYFGTPDLPAGSYTFVVVSVDDADRWLEVEIVQGENVE